MGKQVNFFVNQADITLLQEEATKKGMLTIDGIEKSKEAARQITQSNRFQTYYFLVDNELASEIEYVSFYNDPGNFGASITRSPLIEFIVCPKMEIKLHNPADCI